MTMRCEPGDLCNICRTEAERKRPKGKAGPGRWFVAAAFLVILAALSAVMAHGGELLTVSSCDRQIACSACGCLDGQCECGSGCDCDAFELCAANAPPPSVVKIADCCSGVCVDPIGIVLSAKHCGYTERESVYFPTIGEVPCRVIYVSTEPDGPVALLAEVPGPYPASPVAFTPPTVNQSVYSWGFPGNENGAMNLSFATGKIVDGKTYSAAELGMPPNMAPVRLNIVDGLVPSGGWSGGPLFNADAEVIGLVSACNDKHSLWFPHVEVRKAYLAAVQQLPANRTIDAYLLEVGCDPCNHFKSDMAAGKFAGYTIVAHPAREGGAPQFDYCGQTKVGYFGPGDFLAWLFGCDKARKPSAAPLEPIPDSVSPYAEAPTTPAGDVAALRDQVTKIVTDLQAFKDAGVVGKVAMIDDLRRDLAGAKETAETAQSELAAMKADYAKATEQHPWYWGIPAVILGLIKRRYQHKGNPPVEDLA